MNHSSLARLVALATLSLGGCVPPPELPPEDASTQDSRQDTYMPPADRYVPPEPDVYVPPEPERRADLRITRAFWLVHPPTATDQRFSACLNQDRGGGRPLMPRGDSIVVQNVGAATSPPTTVALGYLEPDGESTVAGTPRPEVPALAPGESFTITGPLCAHVAFGATDPVGTYRMMTRVDPNNEFSESDETNNIVLGPYMFSWDAPTVCLPCRSNANCSAGQECRYRRCDGAGGCYASSSSSCEVIDGVTCDGLGLWDACTTAASEPCPAASECVLWMGGTTAHCARDCTTAADCVASPDPEFDRREQYCTTSHHCIMRCAGPSDTCPGPTRCVLNSAGMYACL